APVPEVNGAPFFVTSHAKVCVSAEPGSVTVVPSVISVPSELLTGAPVIATVGSTLSTTIISASTPVPPSTSVAVTVTRYVPLSSGVNANVAPVPVVNGTPSFVTS